MALTVAQLITKLQAFPEKWRDVVVVGFGGIAEVTDQAESTSIVLVGDSMRYSDEEDADDLDDFEDDEDDEDEL